MTKKEGNAPSNELLSRREFIQLTPWMLAIIALGLKKQLTAFLSSFDKQLQQLFPPYEAITSGKLDSVLTEIDANQAEEIIKSYSQLWRLENGMASPPSIDNDLSSKTECSQIFPASVSKDTNNILWLEFNNIPNPLVDAEQSLLLQIVMPEETNDHPQILDQNNNHLEISSDNEQGIHQVLKRIEAAYNNIFEKEPLGVQVYLKLGFTNEKGKVVPKNISFPSERIYSNTNIKNQARYWTLPSTLFQVFNKSAKIQYFLCQDFLFERSWDLINAKIKDLLFGDYELLSIN